LTAVNPLTAANSASCNSTKPSSGCERSHAPD
jgi:hypothetical protein